jgi:glyoxylase-like metal-dependent hydrolase (beta-lactamase superfamily II)/SAM-dependent methyltransferase
MGDSTVPSLVAVLSTPEVMPMSDIGPEQDVRAMARAETRVPKDGNRPNDEPSGWRRPPRRPRLVKVSDRIYASLDYAISNVLYVVTGSSVVVVDTAESTDSAQAAFAEFRKVCPLPISHIIYTHFHGDHTGGATVFHEPGTQVIAQRRMPQEREKMIELLPFRSRVDELQFGASLDAGERGISLTRHSRKGRPPTRPFLIDASKFQDGGYIPPNTTFSEEYHFEEGGIRFELYRTEGETFDHLMVWLPQERALFPGDLFYSAFPMLNNPMKPDRPVLAWAESLERMRSLHPEYLVPSHSAPRQGVEHIDTVLSNYSSAIRFVHDETVKGINQGLTLEQLLSSVRLPEHLARLPYLQESYGKVDWAVNGVYRHYVGWYSLNPTDLKPSPTSVRDRAVIEAYGSVQPLVRRARRALENGRHQLVLELTDVILNARPLNAEAKDLRVRALQHLGALARNGVERNIYLSAARNFVREKRQQKEFGKVPRPRLKTPQQEEHEPVPESGSQDIVNSTATPIPSPGPGDVSPSRSMESPIFILALPRSFSSVFCAMLGQHPQLYGLPEMQLLLSETVSRWLDLVDRSPAPLAHGALRAIAELYFGGQTDESIKQARGWLNRRAHFTSGFLYETLADRVRPRLLVDKSSIMTYRPEIMRRALRMFPKARFIHLVRHPRGFGESVLTYLVELRKSGPLPPNHWLQRLAAYPQSGMPEGDVDPQRGWAALNEQVRDFLASLPPSQWLRLRAEDVLTDPPGSLRSLCRWLDVSHDAAVLEQMLHPERSPYAQFGPSGARYGNDRSFLRDPVLRPGRAKRYTLEGPLPWRQDGEGLCAAVKQLARQFGYDDATPNSVNSNSHQRRRPAPLDLASEASKRAEGNSEGSVSTTASRSSMTDTPSVQSPDADPWQDQANIGAINAWYDQTMFLSMVQARHLYSDFCNFGYWRADTTNARQASMNLMGKLLELIPDPRGTVLDVACGLGATTRYLLRYYKPSAIAGINISRKQLTRCFRNAPGCNFLLMDATHLAFPDASFDNVICVEAAFHFNTREQFLREARRILKPGGCLVLSDILQDRARGFWRLCPISNYVEDVEAYRELFVRVGFDAVKIVDVTCDCLVGFYTHVLRASREQFLRNQIGVGAFRRQTNLVIQRLRSNRHYLLVSAQKAPQGAPHDQ